MAAPRVPTAGSPDCPPPRLDPTGAPPCLQRLQCAAFLAHRGALETPGGLRVRETPPQLPGLRASFSGRKEDGADFFPAGGLQMSSGASLETASGEKSTPTHPPGRRPGGRAAQAPRVQEVKAAEETPRPPLPADTQLHSVPESQSSASATGRGRKHDGVHSRSCGALTVPGAQRHPGNEVFTGRGHPPLLGDPGFCGSRNSVSCPCFQHDRSVKSTPVLLFLSRQT